MEELLSHYERELAQARRAFQAFAARYPKIAARLSISGENSGDPHVEHMIQSFALLAARLDMRIEDDFPEFTEAMLETLYPRYLQPFPSCSIARFDASGLFGQLTEPRTIERGSPFVAHGNGFRFRSVYDVTLLPLELQDARYAIAVSAPASVPLPARTAGVLSITFAAAGDRADFTRVPGRVRLYLDGLREVVATLADALLLHATAAFAEVDGSGHWVRLPRIPVSPVGFDAQESMLGRQEDFVATSRLLMEYFAFPEKFDFVDIDFAALKRIAGSSGRITLHLAIANGPQDASAAQRMEMLSADHFKLFCTPVVNVFDCEASPIETADEASSYPVVPQAPEIANTAVLSIDAVRLTRHGTHAEQDITPLRSLFHGHDGAASRLYWLTTRDASRAPGTGEHATAIALADLTGAVATAGGGELALDLTCTNRDLPSAMPFGNAQGDLELREDDLHCPIVLLRQPSRSLPPSMQDGALWRILTCLVRRPAQLDRHGLAELKRLFRHHAGLSAASAAQADGLVALEHRARRLWIGRPPCPALVRGLEVRLTVDEPAFIGSSVSLFAEVMDRFFADYVSTNGFVQFVLLSKQTGAELKRCAPRQGAQWLV
nr:type VI secretion system baseplate subunit TssF [Burkholderia sp. Ac-20379]